MPDLSALSTAFEAVRANATPASVALFVLVCTTVLSHLLELALPKLREIALSTETRADDRAITMLEAASPYLHGFAKLADFFLPRLQLFAATQANRAKRANERADAAEAKLGGDPTADTTRGQ